MIVGKNTLLSSRRDVVDFVRRLINPSGPRGQPLRAPYHLPSRDNHMEWRDFAAYGLGQERTKDEVVFTRKQNHFHAVVCQFLQPLGKGDSRKTAA
jgi:hypothetical protein